MHDVSTPPNSALLDDWHVVARVEDIQPGQLLKVHLLGEDVVLWQCDAQILAWQDRCPHRGVPLSGGWIEGETVVCPYHGLVFNAEGHCTRIPAAPQLSTFPKNASVRTYRVQERYGYLWLTLGEPTHSVPEFSEWGQPGFSHFHCGPYWINASPLRVVENFTDVAHFPYTHRDLLGTPELPEIPDYQVEIDESGITAQDIQCYQPNPEGTGEAKRVSYRYKILRPLVAYFEKRVADSHFSIFLAITPVEELQSIVWLGISRNYALEVANDSLQAFQDHLMSQDIPILESQRPRRLPLDLQAEFHIPSDRLAIAYRKWLKQLGVKFGAMDESD